MLRNGATETTPLYPPASEGRENRYPRACAPFREFSTCSPIYRGEGIKGGVLCPLFLHEPPMFHAAFLPRHCAIGVFAPNICNFLTA